MRRVMSWRLLIVLVTAAGVWAPVTVSAQRGGSQPSPAFASIDLRSGRTIATEQQDRLNQPVVPGSVIKIATLAAALEAGVVTPRSGILCTRRVRVGGHLLTCAHPDLHRPLNATEALSHSCNTYFTSIAARTPRAALDRALADLGLPPTDPSAPIAAAAVGVEGIRVAPRRLVDAMARIAAEPSPLRWRPETLTAVRQGLRAAAEDGTAGALGARGIDALAKTGTVVVGGVSQGLVVGVTPSVNPTIGFALLVSGASGSDAAMLAAQRLGDRSSPPRAAPRIGITRPSGGYDVRTIPLDDYVAAVVAGETAGQTPAALEALAITVRTYTEANRGRHAAEGFDLCDLTHCQVMRAPNAGTRHAASATSGRVLLDRGRLATVFYTASCGGHTERPSRVWRGAPDPPYLASHRDEACGGRPQWSSELTARDLVRTLAAGRFRGEMLRDIVVTSRTASGRVEWLRLEGLTPPEISGDDLRTLVGRTLGWQHLRSTMFDVARTGGGFRFSGRGAGHGVGLCVIGAANLAASGESAEAILARYFPGLRAGALPVIASTTIDIVLPSAERAEESDVRALVSRTLVALAAKLAVDAPMRVTLRFHPTVESYQRDTGRPWYTAATSSASTIDLLPLATLRTRGILESTIAHELVHVLTAPAMAKRPLWVVEGLASHLAGERESVATPANCPSDDALRRPASSDALQRAMSEATRCVSARIRAGEHWQEMR